MKVSGAGREMRAFCPRCLKAASTCYCDQVRELAPSTRFIILQHPLEYRKAIGTGRMARLSLRGSELLVGATFGPGSAVARLCEDPSNFCVILFPGADSVDLSLAEKRAALLSRAAGLRLVVFVIDGTWSCAKKMVRRSPALGALPRVSFQPDRPSEYSRIRQEPAEHCLSTLEAISRILGLIEPGVDCSPMLQLFQKMVAAQEAYAPKRRR